MDDNKKGVGYDTFKDGVFSYRDWSAEVVTEPQEIRAQIDSFALIGRKIKRMQMIGLSYMHQRYSVESVAYGQLMHLSEEERWRKSSYHNIDDKIVFNRYTEVDEPFMIEFEDGDVFEIDIPQEEEFRMSMNRIPWDIEHGVNAPNLDADVLFSPCIGRTIVRVELNPGMLNCDLGGIHAFKELPYEGNFVTDIIFRLDDGTALKFGGVFDFCAVSYIGTDGEVGKLSYGELKEGLHNWEDLHVDKVTGFDPDSGMIYFNEKGEDRAGLVYLTLSSSSCRESKAYISDDDSLLIEWCISRAVGEWFDECGIYRLGSSEWYEILADADRLLRAETAAEMAETLDAWLNEAEYMAKNRRPNKDALWDSRAQYRRQIKDLRAWSRLVLKDDDVMYICGI